MGHLESCMPHTMKLDNNNNNNDNLLLFFQQNKNNVLLFFYLTLELILLKNEMTTKNQNLLVCNKLQQ